MPRHANIGLFKSEPLTRRDAQLQLNQIMPSHRLGHGMLDLGARIDLDE